MDFNAVGVVLLEIVPLLMGAFGRYTNIYANLRLDYALLTAKGRSLTQTTNTILSHHQKQILKHHDEHGFLAAYFLRNIFPEASALMDKIEHHVLRGDPQHAISFMEAQAASFNMTAVAGAIVAQVAITALSLTALADSHWTTEAFFIVSLVCGTLSVFLSCAMYPSTRGLYNSDRVRDWLSKPTGSDHKVTLYSNLRAAEVSIMLPRRRLTGESNQAGSPTNPNLKTRMQQVLDYAKTIFPSLYISLPLYSLFLQAPNPAIQETVAHNNETLHHLDVVGSELSAHKWEVVSCYAAIMLVVPTRLLTLSLSYFIVGLGIYLGSVYTKSLIPQYGSGSLGILIIFIVVVVLALLGFYVPRAMKSEESWAVERYEELMQIVRSADNQRVGEQEIGISTAPPTPETITTPQSVHVRRGRVVSFVVPDSDADNDGTQRPLQREVETVIETDPTVEIEIQAPEANASKSSSTEISALTLRPLKETSSEPTRSGLSREPPNLEVNDSSLTSSLDFQSTMENWIRAQEESVRASRKLLELYQNKQ